MARKNASSASTDPNNASRATYGTNSRQIYPIASTKNKQDDVAKSSNTIESEQPDTRRSTREW